MLEYVAEKKDNPPKNIDVELLGPGGYRRTLEAAAEFYKTKMSFLVKAATEAGFGEDETCREIVKLTAGFEDYIVSGKKASRPDLYVSAAPFALRIKDEQVLEDHIVIMELRRLNLETAGGFKSVNAFLRAQFRPLSEYLGALNLFPGKFAGVELLPAEGEA